MKIEVCEDGTGWKWIMPQLDAETVDRLGLGTWDLMDWTYGTRESFEHAGWCEDYKLPFYAKPLWFIENIFRFLVWYILLKHGKNRVFKIVSKMHGLIFDIAWKVSERGYYVGEAGKIDITEVEV